MDNSAAILFGGKWRSAGFSPQQRLWVVTLKMSNPLPFGTLKRRKRRAPFLARAGSVFKLPAVSDQTTTQLKQLLATPEPPALGPQPRAGVLAEAALNAKLDSLFRETKLLPKQQELIRSLLLLWHDHLDASHDISQGIENADGSFVHAIMHRREPDYWNAKYWWRQVGTHPAFPEISKRVAGLLNNGGAGEFVTKLLPGGEWDACAFVDLCEQAASDPAQVDLLRAIQRIETEVLLESFLNR